MSGKPYTMKEMKSIVDYLTEKKAYGEIKGRKMWLDYERSKLTDRTWQSLKETFLKRILPDIHNPYYQLSLTQISSFRQGYDMETKLNSKLEVRTVSKESSVKAEEHENTEQPSTSNSKEVENNSGEGNKNPLDHRSSVETFVLDTCYENADDIQRDLESPIPKDKENGDKAPTKSLRDFITYSEPLTPMLQEVIDDYATDEDSLDKESNLKISEDENTFKKGNIIAISSETDEISNNVDLEPQKNNENLSNDKSTNQNIEKSINVSKSLLHKKDLPAQENRDSDNGTRQTSEQIEPEHNNVKNTKEDGLSKTDNIEKNAPKKVTKNVPDRNKDTDDTSQRTSSQNISNTTTDTLIPNNQEALNTVSDSFKPIEADIEPQPRNNQKNTKKRANSQESTNIKEKKKRLNVIVKPASVSDTDANIKRKKLITGSKLDLSTTHNTNPAESKKVPDKRSKQKCSPNRDSTEKRNDRVVCSSAECTNNKEKSQERQNEDTGDITINSNITNPCLKSVSLYEEQFTSQKYSGSSDEVITSTNPNPQEEKNKKNKNPRESEILLLSHSELDSPGSKKEKEDAPVRTALCKSEREKALANVFGFSSGAVTKSRKRRVSYQNRSARRQSRHRISSGSSEWTSETDRDFVSPPRGRRNKFSRKYLKPKSARILSLEDEGGLFVMYGKKIYPVIKDGKKVKNYVTYAPERDSIDEEENYWKLKYMEEKKRTEKLTKLLHQTTEPEPQSKNTDVILDLTESSPSKKTKVEKYQAEPKKNLAENPAALPKESSEMAKEPLVRDKTLIIKITKKNEEVQLEGHWSQIHPVLDHVVQIFNKELEPKNDAGSSRSYERAKSISSRLSTPDIQVPAVQEVHEKVKKLESEIFKEIESLDRQNKRSPTPTSLSTEDSNRFINKRKRGRPKKSITSSVSETSSPGKEKGVPPVNPQLLAIEENVGKADAAQITNGASIVTRQTRTPKKMRRESTERNETNVINTRTKSLKLSKQTEKIIDDETDVRYKLPSSSPSMMKTTRKSAANKTQKEQKSNNRYDTRTEKTPQSRENDWISYVESSQGYQDSDISPNKFLRKKKKNSSTLLYKKSRNKLSRNRLRRKQYYYNEMSDNSSNSCSKFKLQLRNSKNSSLNSAVYRTESYQLLMPKVSSFKCLDMIEENPYNKVDIEQTTENMKLFDAKQIHNFSYNITEDLKTISNTTDIDISSSVTLPPSPVLSIVENMSISKNMYSNIDYSEKSANEDENGGYNNQDFNINNDYTMPLVEQNCGVTAGGQSVTEPECSVNKTKPVVTESFLNKILAVNLKDVPSLSEIFTQKFQDLFLDSAKKTKVKDDELTKIDVDSNNIKSTIKGRSKKRCSTPLKRQINRNTKANKRQTDAIIEEEHTETFSQEGRKSCPPLICFTDNTICSNIINENGNVKKKGRKTNDNIIKVKIIRPKSKNKRRETNPEEIDSEIVEEPKLSDSGINESGYIHDLNDSVKLIHNHSETCLQANECISDSLQQVENSMKSVLSIDNSNNSSVINEINSERKNSPCISIGPVSLSDATSKATQEDMNSYQGDIINEPKGNNESLNSFITEDLSDNDNVETGEHSKWYLLSEDENTNTNFAYQNGKREVSYRSELSKLFPVACAVPNLSAVTEVSAECDFKITDLD